MIRAGQSAVVRKIVAPRRAGAPARSNVAVLAPTVNHFRDHFGRVGNGSFKGRTFQTDDIVYWLCDKRSDVDGIEFDSILRIASWYAGPGSGERLYIQQVIRARAGHSGILVEDV